MKKPSDEITETEKELILDIMELCTFKDPKFKDLGRLQKWERFCKGFNRKPQAIAAKTLLARAKEILNND